MAVSDGTPSEAFTALQKLLQQAGYTDKPVEEVKLADLPGDWNELDHPHDPHTGKWVKKGHGVYGKHPHLAGPGHYTGISGKTVNFHVTHMDSKLFATPQGNVLQIHPSGHTAPHTLHTSLGDTSPKAGLLAKAHNGELEELHPEIPQSAKKVTEESVKVNKTQLKESLAKLHSSNVTVDAGGKKVTLAKNQQAYKTGSGTLVTTHGKPSAYVSHITGASNPIGEGSQKHFTQYIHPDNLIADGAGSPGPQKDKLGTHPNVVGNTFHHPVTGAQHELKSGDVLHQHKKVKESFLVMHPDSSGTKIDKTGKATKQAAGNKQINAGVVSKNYTKIAEHTTEDAAPEEPAPTPSHTPSSEMPSAVSKLQNKLENPPPKNDPLKHVTSTLGLLKEHAAQIKEKKAATALKTVKVGPHDVTYGPGEVLLKGNSPGYENYVVVYHADGKISQYSHDPINSPGNTKLGVTPPEVVNTPDKALASHFGKTRNLQIFNPDAPKVEDSVQPVTVKKLKKTPTPVGTPDHELGDSYAAFTYAQSAWNTVKKHFGSTYYSMGETWDSGDWTKRLSLLADPKFTAQMDSAVATLAPVAKWPKDKIATQDKSAITKERKRFELLASASRLAQKIQDPESSSSEIASEIQLFEDKFSPYNENKTFGSSAPFQAHQLLAALHMGVQLKNYKAKVAGLGFDPTDGTHDDYQNYAATHGVVDAGGLTFEQAKLWTQLDLNDPTIVGATFSAKGAADAKAQIEKMAHSAVVGAQVKIAAAKALEAATPPKTANSSVEKALAKADDTAQQHMSESPVQFTGTLAGGSPDEPADQFTVTKTGPDNWQMKYSDGVSDPITVTDSMVEAMQTKGQLTKVAGAPPASDIEGANQAAFTALTGVQKPSSLTTPTQLNTAIKEFGGNYVGKMDIPTKQQWLNLHIKGDELGKYSLEEAAAKKEKGSGLHKLADTHPGSPDSPAGKKAWQALTDQTAQFGYPAEPGNWTDDGLAGFFKTNLPASADGLSHLAKPSQADIVSAWLEYHNHLGTPSAAPQPVADTTTSEFTLPNGKVITLEPGEKVLQTSTGATRIYHTDHTLTQYAPEQNTPGYNHYALYGGKSLKAIEEHYQAALDADWKDVTPAAVKPASGATVQLGKHSVPLVPSDVVFFHQPGNQVRVFHADGTVSRWNNGGQVVDHVGTSYTPESFLSQYSHYVKLNTADLLKEVEPGPEIQGVAKPVGVSVETWQLANAADDPRFSTEVDKFVGEDLAGKSGPELDALIAAVAGNKANLNGVMPQELKALPVPTKKLLIWGQQGNQHVYGKLGDLPGIQEFKTSQKEMATAILAKVGAGQYIPSDAPTWTDNKGKVWQVPAGGKVYAPAGTSFPWIMVNPDGTGVISGTTALGAPQKAAGHLLQNPSGYGYDSLIFEAPADVTLSDSQADGKDFGQFDWDTVASAEKTPFDKVAISVLNKPNEMLVKEALNLQTSQFANDTNLSIPTQQHYQAIHDQAEQLPPSVQKLLVQTMFQGDHSIAEIVAYKLAKKHYGGAKSDGPTINPSAPYAKYIAKGETTSDDIYYWPSSFIKSYLQDFGISYSSYEGKLNLAKKVALHLATAKSQAYEADPVETNKAPSDQLKLSKIDKELGGMHSKQVYVDQHKNEWFSKTYPHDPNAKARIDAEAMGNKIGQLFSFHQPEARIMSDLEGTYSYLQHLFPSDGSLEGFGAKDLSETQLSQVMEQHVLDWLISNHDSHGGNLQRWAGTDNIVGIDKGQAFKFFPNDQLAVGYLPPGNPESIWYDQFYHAVQSGQISKELADKVATKVLIKAQYVQKRYDDQFRQLLDTALANRTTWPSEFPSRQAFTDAVMARKASIATDFEKFYQDLYANSPHEWTIDTESLTSHKINDDTYVNVHPELIADVVKSAVHGKSLFFNTHDLEDSHMLLYTEKSPQGKDMLSGEAKLRKDADLLITNWLKQQTVEDKTGYKDHSMQNVVTQSHAELPYNDAGSWNHLLYFVKNVNYHANGNGDYNEGEAEQAKQVMQKIITASVDLENWENNHSGELYPKPINGVTFQTHEQQEAFQAMAKDYSAMYDDAFSAKQAGQKTTPGKMYYQFTYNPTPGILEKEKAAQAAKNPTPSTEEKPPTWSKASGTKFVYDSADDVWKADGKNASGQLTPDEMAQLVESNSAAWSYDAGSTANDTAEGEATTAAGKVLKVIKKKNSGTLGEFHPETGELVHSGSTLDNGYSGQKYEVHANDHIVEYRPWTEPGVTTSQQGLLRFSVKDWNGSTDQLEDVMDTMRSMGVDLTPADEQSLELHYWRHLRGILQDRADRHEAKWKKTLDAIDTDWKPGMSADAELTMLKNAWALSLGKDTVDKADYLPKFSRNRLQTGAGGATAGKPYWNRPDFTMAELHKIYGDNLPGHSLSNQSNLTKIVDSGGLWATEERLRLLGTFIDGMSSGADQGTGGATSIFFRQNVGVSNVMLHPKVMLRTSNYTFPGDEFGNVSQRKDESYFDLAKASKHKGGSNELMIKNGVSLLDDIGVIYIYDTALRSKLLERLKKAGITEIHGIPIDQIIVGTTQDASETIKKLWKDVLAEEAKL